MDQENWPEHSVLTSWLIHPNSHIWLYNSGEYIFLNEKKERKHKRKKDMKIRIHSVIKDRFQVPGIRRNTKE